MVRGIVESSLWLRFLAYRRSFSSLNQLIFEPGTDILRAKALLQERLIQPQGLPTTKSP